MTINFTLSDSELKDILKLRDPEREVWRDISEFTEEDVQDILQDILDAWLERWA